MIILTIHFVETLFYLISVKSCYWKKWQWKCWNSWKRLNQSHWGKEEKRKSWTIQSDSEKSVSCRDLAFDNRLDLPSSRKNSESFFVTSIFTSGTSFIPSTVNWKRFRVYRPSWRTGGCILATFRLFGEYHVLEQRLVHFSCKDQIANILALWGPHGFCCNYSTLNAEDIQLWKGIHRNKWV